MCILKFNKKIKENLNSLYEGSISFKDKISPYYINMKNPKYLVINNVYYGGLLVTNYNREHSDLILKNIIDSNININLSIFYEKEDPYKTIKDITYHIGNVGMELKSHNDNRQDIDLAAFTYSDAKYIRKEIQVNNQDLYYLYIYIHIFSSNVKELEYLMNKLEGLCQGTGIITRRAYFREEETFLSGIPSMLNSQYIKEATKRNVLTNGLIATYPFISSSIFDEEGIFIGTNRYNNSLVFIDRYNTNKYKNANVCIFGTSGAGKSFFTKLNIIRYRLFNIYQYIIDPEREYENLCAVLEGEVIKIGPTSNTYINVFDIRKDSIEDVEKGFLATKITKLVGFFNLIFGEMDEETKALLEEKIIETYRSKEITFEDNTLYKENNIFKEKEDMPILSDLYYLLGNDEKTKVLKIKLRPFIDGSMSYFNHHTNVEINSKLIVADLYEMGEDNLQYGMYLFTELFWDKIKKDRNKKKAIYLDEIWRLIGITSNKNVASFVYKIFKTIRKYGGSAVAITQDVSDLFSLDNGTYGKSILNNSSNKIFFSLEEENINLLDEFVKLSEKEKIEIKTLKRGECLIFAGENHILTKIESSEMENEIIKKDV